LHRGAAALTGGRRAGRPLPAPDACAREPAAGLEDLNGIAGRVSGGCPPPAVAPDADIAVGVHSSPRKGSGLTVTSLGIKRSYVYSRFGSRVHELRGGVRAASRPHDLPALGRSPA